jgi:hypothetical protein
MRVAQLERVAQARLVLGGLAFGPLEPNPTVRDRYHAQIELIGVLAATESVQSSLTHSFRRRGVLP